MLDLKTKPTSVAGPLGPVTMDDLPSSSTTYWTARRKAEVLAAIDGGLMDFQEACARYSLSSEELGAWRRLLDRAGVPGLRITNRQRLRDQYIIG
ncbi:CtrA inhibitor SciP [Sphingopyxis fribergensis]